MGLAIPLRFINLGYSDYIGDEHKAFLQVGTDENYWSFFMSRRKGPMQFIVSFLPFLVTHDYRNELIQRIPFATISVLAVAVFYLMLQRLTKNRFISFISSTLFLVNGFIVGFGRIAQYQSLNLLFSFLSIYFYSTLLEKDKEDHLKHALIGTVFFSLSLLSHWDAIFILPLILYIFIKYLNNKGIKIEDKREIILQNFKWGCYILLPFLIPYIFNQISSPSNMGYFSRRIETGDFNSERYGVLLGLYNPFVALPFVLSTALIGLLGIRKNYPFVLWFLYSYGIFELLVRKPGTHIYNFVLPALVLASYGIYYIVKIFPKYLKVIPLIPISVVLGFLYYQSYLVFVDHSIEYPWSQKEILSLELPEDLYVKFAQNNIPKEILNFTTPKYSIDQKLPLFGFPHKRYWNDINTWVNEQNKSNDEHFGYVSNEAKTISDWYMNVKYKSDNRFYAIGIKRPLDFVVDWKHTNIGGKNLVKEFKDEFGSVVVKVYRVE